MKKFFLTKLVLFFLTMTLHGICIAQENIAEYEEPEEEIIPERTTLHLSSDQPDENAETTTNPQHRPSQRDSPLDAPPDCPECVPDPGGGVTDVPFDKNLLFILAGGAVFVFVKSEKRKKKSAVV